MHLPSLPPGFTPRGILGRGASTIVIDAFDEGWQRPVAIKTLIDPSPDAIDQLQRDFRAVSTIDTPELPRMIALLMHEGAPMVVMEHAGERDLEALMGTGTLTAREVAADLLRGLATLHHRGLVHGDIKPANVIHKEHKGVVLVDLGLSQSTQRPWTGQSGTLAYFAPEQLHRLAPASPKTDLYAAGLILLELLWGSALTKKKRRQLYQLAWRARPISFPESVSEGSAVTDLVRKLLSREPTQRPSALDALRLLRLDVPHHLWWFGREAELAILTAWWQGKDPVLVLCGAAGSGKSALLGWWSSERRRAGTPVFWSRCMAGVAAAFHPFETILDAAVSRFQGETPDLDVVVDMIIQALDKEGTSWVWIIDDVQWMDPETEQALALFLPHARGRLLLASRDPEASVVRRFRDRSEKLMLSPLPEAAAREWLQRAGRPSGPDLDRLVDLCNGTPFLLNLLATETSATDLNAAWASRLHELPAAAVRTIQVVAEASDAVKAIALQPVCAPEPSLPILRLLVERGLLRWLPDVGFVQVALAHDLLREGLPRLPRLEAARLAPMISDHRLRAALLDRSGDPSSAADARWSAAQEAVSRDAWQEALRLVEAAISDTSAPGHEVEAFRARCMAATGNPIEGAQAAERAIQLAPDDITRHRHMVLAAHLWLGAGHSVQGRATLRSATAGLGFPLSATRWGAGWTVAADLTRLYTRRFKLAETLDTRPESQARLDAAWSASGPLVFLDYATGVAAVTRYLRLALAAGDRNHTLRAAGLAWQGIRLSGRPSPLLTPIENLLTDLRPDASPQVAAFLTATDAYVAVYTDQMGQSVVCCDRALSMYDARRDDVWERPIVQIHRLLAMAFSTSCADAWADEVERTRDRLHRSGNRLGAAMADIAVGYIVDLRVDAPAQAIARLDAAAAVFDELPVSFAWILAFAKARVCLYTEQPGAARVLLEGAPVAQLDALQHVRMSFQWLRGMTGAMAASQGESWGSLWLSQATAVLASEHGHWGVGHLDALQAASATLSGDAARAVQHHADAISAYRHAGLKVFCDPAHVRDPRRWRLTLWPTLESP